MHPLWQVGFRPFFTLALISGALLPLIWVLAFGGFIAIAPRGLSLVQWHAHEMLFGFGWAVLGGFLLTASKNWVHIRGLNGFPLVVAAALWLVERYEVMNVSGPLNSSSWLKLILLNVFLIYVAGYVVWSLVWHRKTDTFADNYFFIIALPLFLLAKSLILIPETFQLGYLLAIGLFRLAFAVMFERTIPQFMKNSLAAELPRNLILNTAIKAAVLLCAFESFMAPYVAAPLLFIAASLLFARFCLWKPVVALKKFEIGIMYAGYLGLVLHLYLESLRLIGRTPWIGTLPLHTFTFLCMGLVIPAMLLRISQGHTGRKIIFNLQDRTAIWVMASGAFFRLVFTQLWPSQYILWISLAGVAWSTCFTLLAIRLIPFLWQPRVDGREH